MLRCICAKTAAVRNRGGGECQERGCPGVIGVIPDAVGGTWTAPHVVTSSEKVESKYERNVKYV
jgi:hypothetical protein